MATLNHIAHPEHALVWMTPQSTVTCSGCNQRRVGEGGMYSCNGCGFHIHRRCGMAPPSNKFKHVHSQHQMTLFYQKPTATTRRRCDVCREGIFSGLYYQCAPCDFDAHLSCATGNVNPARATTAASRSRQAPSSSSTKAARAGKAVGMGLLGYKALSLLSEVTLGMSLPDAFSEALDSEAVSTTLHGVDDALFDGNISDMIEFFDDDDEDGWDWNWDRI